MGKQLDPDSYWITEDGVGHFHRNKWSRYAQGLHVPQSRLVVSVDSKCPGSASELNHVFWTLVRRRPEHLGEIAKFEGELSVQAQMLLSRWQSRQSARGGVNRRFANALQLLDCLDSLAAMLLQCERARALNDEESAFQWAGYLYEGLMIHGLELLQHGIARPLVELMNEKILGSVSHQGLVYGFPGNLYIEGIQNLSHLLWHIKGVPYSSMSERQMKVYIQEVLSGNFGWDLKFALNPVCSVIESQVASETVLKLYIQKTRLFIWGWNMLSSRRSHEDFPPYEVFDGSNLSARSETQQARDKAINEALQAEFQLMMANRDLKLHCKREL